MRKFNFFEPPPGGSLSRVTTPALRGEASLWRVTLPDSFLNLMAAGLAPGWQRAEAGGPFFSCISRISLFQVL